ncbi:hypothetical protein SESBI_02031 [Sesbania bispinosa]|nr:hypothetical protein SESBI_02031 [Sesbania bispinosa]
MSCGGKSQSQSVPSLCCGGQSILGRLVSVHIHKWSKLCCGARNLIIDEDFRDALYLIDIGQNDSHDSFSENMRRSSKGSHQSSLKLRITLRV